MSDHATAPIESELLTPAEAAAILRKHPGTLANWRFIGAGPHFVKIGRSVRYRRRDLDAWLDRQTRTSTSATGPPSG
jgi:hypothetical protein